MTYYERKALLPHGAQRQTARALGVDEAKVSRVMKGEIFDKEVAHGLWSRMAKANGKRPTFASVFPALPTGAK